MPSQEKKSNRKVGFNDVLDFNEDDINKYAGDKGITPIHIAARTGDIGLLTKSLLEEGADVNAKDSKGKTPLHYASEKGHPEIVEALTKVEGINVNAIDNRGITPLYLAAVHGATVIKKDADVNAVAEHSRTKVTAALIKAGADVNAKDKYGRTPLHRAAEKGHLKTVEALIKVEGVNVNAENSSGSTPLYAAIKAGNKEVIKALVSKGAKYSKLPIFDWQTISRGYTLRIVFYKIYNFSTGGEKNSNDSTAAPNNAAPRSSNEISRSGALVKPNESPNKD